MPKLVDVDQRRNELADAAARVIATKGLDGASLRTVAAEAGWTTGALVHYFANKRELLTFTLQTSLERRRSRHLERRNLSPRDAVRSTLAEALPTTPQTQLHWVVTLAFAAQAVTDPDLAEVQRDAYRQFRETMVGLVEAASPRRRSPEDVAVEAERLIALVDGIALQALFDPASWPTERQEAALDAGLGVSG